jgi:hypothetical protein
LVPANSGAGNEVGHERVTVLQCMGCRDATIVVEKVISVGAWTGVHWWPVPGAGTLDPAVPDAVASAYDEGSRCLAVQADRGAVVMFRGALAEIVTNKGSAAAQAKGTLFNQLDQMAQDGTLHPSLIEWAKEIRVLGNAGAHPNTLAPVSHDDATDLSQLTRRMIEMLYELPARIDRSRQTRGTTP